MIVGINGVAHSGKDTVGRICIDKWGCKRLAFADRMKEFLLAQNPIISYVVTSRTGPTYEAVRLAELVRTVGWDKAKEHTEVRDLLIRTGTEAGRKVLGEDIWIKQVSPLYRKDKNYVVTDVRFLNEAEWVRNHAGIMVRVERPGYGPVRDHDSENHDTSLWDVVIHNNGTLEDLERATLDRLREYF